MTLHGAAKPHLLVRQIQPFHLHVRREAPHCALVQRMLHHTVRRDKGLQRL
jgi:hypothetical protein